MLVGRAEQLSEYVTGNTASDAHDASETHWRRDEADAALTRSGAAVSCPSPIFSS